MAVLSSVFFTTLNAGDGQGGREPCTSPQGTDYVFGGLGHPPLFPYAWQRPIPIIPLLGLLVFASIPCFRLIVFTWFDHDSVWVLLGFANLGWEFGLEFGF